MDVVGAPDEALPREVVAETSPTQPASTPQARRRKLVITAAVLAALAATAVVGFVFAPDSKSNVAIVAAGPTSAPAHDQARRRATIDETDDPGAARTAQRGCQPASNSVRRLDSAAVHRLAARSISRAVPTHLVPEPRTEPAPASHRRTVSQHEEQPAEKVAPS